MNNMEEMKSKIKKLIALSQDNPSDEEGYSAMRMAQTLMAKYKIEQSEIEDKELEKGCIKKRTEFSYGTRSSDHYMNTLATIIADNFCCVNYVSNIRGTRTNYICFMGMEEDISIAIEVMTLANHAIIRGYNKVYKNLCIEYDVSYVPARYFNPAKEGYIAGYLEGLKDVLESQKEQHQEWGLVLVAPQEAKEYISSLENRASKCYEVDNSFYMEGYRDGKNIQLNKKLQEGN